MSLVLPTYVADTGHDIIFLRRDIRCRNRYFMSTFDTRFADMSSPFWINVEMSAKSRHVVRHLQLSRTLQVPSRTQV